MLFRIIAIFGYMAFCAFRILDLLMIGRNIFLETLMPPLDPVDTRPLLRSTRSLRFQNFVYIMGLLPFAQIEFSFRKKNLLCAKRISLCANRIISKIYYFTTVCAFFSLCTNRIYPSMRLWIKLFGKPCWEKSSLSRGHYDSQIHEVPD